MFCEEEVEENLNLKHKSMNEKLRMFIFKSFKSCELKKKS